MNFSNGNLKRLVAQPYMLLLLVLVIKKNLINIYIIEMGKKIRLNI